jgi:hypothetical protein
MLRASARVLIVVLTLSNIAYGAGDQRRSGDDLAPRDRREKPALRFKKLDSGLNRILSVEDPFTEAATLGYRMRDSLIQVVAVTEEQRVTEIEAWLTAKGAAFVLSARGLVEAFVPVALLPALNEHERILSVRRPYYLPMEPDRPSTRETKLLSYTTEGLHSMNGDAWHIAGYGSEHGQSFPRMKVLS